MFKIIYLKFSNTTKCLTAIALICLMTIIVGCSTMSEPESSLITVNADSIVQFTNGESKEIPVGTTIELKQDPVLIESKGNVSTLVVPHSNKSKTAYQLKTRSLIKWGNDAIYKHADVVITDILSKVYEVQILIGQRDPNLALQKVLALKDKYPNISYLNFLEASCLSLLGKNEQAIKTLETALKLYPDNIEAKSLLDKLKPRRPAGAQ